MTHRAFVYGTNGLPGPSHLRYAKTDAGCLMEVLRSPRCNYEVTSPDPASPKFAKLDVLDNAIKACSPNDTFLLYFAGHGILEGGRLCLVWQEEADDEVDAAIEIDQILGLVKRCKAASKLVVLDCCHAGAAAQGARGTGLPVEKVTERRPDNYLILMGSRRLETVNEFAEFGGSFMADALRRALGDEFDQADSDGDRRLSFADLTGWIDRRHDGLPNDKKKLVPKPHHFGKRDGPLFLTPEAPGWTPQGEDLPDGSRMMLLPLRPFEGWALGIGQHPVTNAQYRRFVEETDHREPEGRFFPGDGENRDLNQWQDGFRPWRVAGFDDPSLPVTCVSYQDVLAYRRWLTRKLQKAGRRSVEALIPSPRLWQVALYGQEREKEEPLRSLPPGLAVHHRDKTPAPIDQDGVRASATGVSDLIGNVWEWCFFVQVIPKKVSNASGYVRVLQSQRQREIRGGGFLDDMEQVGLALNATKIGGVKASHFDLGFRMAGMFALTDFPKETQDLLALQRPGSDALWADLITWRERAKDG